MAPAQRPAARSGTRLDAALQGRPLTVDRRAEHEVKQLERIFKDTKALELGERHRHEDCEQVKVELAPCYGTLRKDRQRMGEALTVMVAESLKLLSEARGSGEELDFNTVQSLFMQSASMVHGKEDSVEKYRYFPERKTNFFSKRSRPIEAMCNEIEGWFSELIQDKNVLESTLVGLSWVKDIVVRHGVSKKKRGSWDEVLLDIKLLRFPDMETPFFRVYCIRLAACAQREPKICGFITKNRNGIRGEYHSCVYKPRRDLIAELSQKARDDAKRKLEVFFPGEA